MADEQQKKALKETLERMGFGNWLPLMRFFMPQLLQDQVLLFELLTDRANWIARENQTDPVSELYRLWDVLKLKLETK